MDQAILVDVEHVVIPEGRRPANPETIKQLAASINAIGLCHPITVRKFGDKYTLVAGLHRLKAFEKLGKEWIPAQVSSMSIRDAEMIEIAENLHRADLTSVERSELTARWIELADDKLSQLATVSGGRGNEGGIRAASRDLGIDKDEAHRAVKIASISERAKAVAREAHLDDNQSALLEVARAPEAEQVAVIERIRDAGSVAAARRSTRDFSDAIDRELGALMKAWGAASAEARNIFLRRIKSAA